jgi:hypothetical protein
MLLIPILADMQPESRKIMAVQPICALKSINTNTAAKMVASPKNMVAESTAICP